MVVPQVLRAKDVSPPDHCWLQLFIVWEPPLIFRLLAKPKRFAELAEPITPEVLPGLMGPLEVGGAGGGVIVSGLIVPVISVAALTLKFEMEPERIRPKAVPEISVFELPELRSVNTLDVPPEPVVEQVPVRALE